VEPEPQGIDLFEDQAMDLKALFHILLPCVVKVHVVLYATSLMAFWAAVFTRKGGDRHIFFGRVFVWCVYGALTLGTLPLSYNLIEPFVAGAPSSEPLATIVSRMSRLHLFLLYGWVLTLASVRQGVRAIQTKNHRDAMRTPSHVALAYATVAASFVLFASALALQEPFDSYLFIVSPVGCWLGWSMLRFVGHPRHLPWWYEHMRCMLTTGILLHMALFAFLLLRFQLFPHGLRGVLFLWVALPLLGLLAGHVWSRFYRHRFGESPLGDQSGPRDNLPPEEVDVLDGDLLSSSKK
jgi:hypothetical protein